MAHPILDDSKTWTWLLENKLRDLKDFINRHPKQIELERIVRRSHGGSIIGSTWLIIHNSGGTS